ncbi:chemotaxis protein CheX [Candidatus Uabimicrobium amorphum]|uniref:Chemotaxis protein CheX n=1 Tax=Uabimicrobium amorphum TaxID=2596890 RepID=A0A5S9IRZ3_UABAM|nr:chemotaxis protein CheX [Candidatus Uabimicrobium amorphum]BBM86070.1 chemotaxis protein CheX [Candidatus Uabimicrobium amorphum]
MSVKFFGQFLLERGRILKEELMDALDFQKSVNVKLGTLALDAGYLKAEQIEGIHSEQQRTDKMFGEIALEQNLLSPEQLEELLVIQKNERITLGEALVQKGYLTLGDLEVELTAYKEEQKGYTVQARQAIENLQGGQIADTFLDVTAKLLLRLVDMEVQPIESHNDKERIAPFMWNVYQQFFGDTDGTYIISLSDEPFLKIASQVAHEKIWEVNDFAKDSVMEFANIVVGNTASKLSQEDIRVDLKPSKVVTSLGNIEIPENADQTIAVSLASQSYSLQVSVVYSPPQKS